MNRLLLFLVLSGVALSAAGQTPSGSSVEVRGSWFQVPSTPYAIWDLENYTGAYHLSTGERMC